MPVSAPPAPTSLPEVRVGMVALLDAAPLVAAVETGAFERHGVRVRLCRELGWANIREKLDLGELEAAHCPAAVLPAHSQFARSPARRLITAVALGAGCNAVTLSKPLWEAGVRDAATLVAEAAARREKGRRPIRLGVVLAASSHNLLLRWWLESAGGDPDTGFRISIVPPPLMPRMLAAGHLDGYCVGEPWNQIALAAGHGFVAEATCRMYPGHPEKVLAVQVGWAEQHPDLHRGLVRGLVEAARWCDLPANRRELARMLSTRDRVGVDAAVLEAGLAGRLDSAFARLTVPEFAVFARRQATYPFRSQMLWCLGRLQRWRLLPTDLDAVAAAGFLFRSDLHRRWVADLPDPLGVSGPLPVTDMRSERFADVPRGAGPVPARPLL